MFSDVDKSILVFGLVSACIDPSAFYLLVDASLSQEEKTFPLCGWLIV